MAQPDHENIGLYFQLRVDKEKRIDGRGAIFCPGYSSGVYIIRLLKEQKTIAVESSLGKDAKIANFLFLLLLLLDPTRSSEEVPVAQSSSISSVSLKLLPHLLLGKPSLSLFVCSSRLIMICSVSLLNMWSNCCMCHLNTRTSELV
nr:hypothetical protein Iba_chr11dCG1740 [Ipomoea batatas]